ncbi:MAG: DUF721 domain-containing protein [Deltaproteobacteria bacterium]|nr:DUF721 domain-containing protein [Deltaproteobacteria bacterium]MCL5277759.1 DUF721 domain-containing protein [Deltaproteobacteria bacterium]
MKDIKEIIEELKSDSGFSRYSEGLRLYEQWSDITGGYLSDSSEPSMIKDGVLFVAVKNSIVLQEMTYRKDGILRNINGHEDMPRIKDIKFYIKAGPR